jgi:transcriptional antiterminator RfaH
MTDWYLVYTKARQEDLAAAGLEEQGYQVYLPKLKTRRRRSQGMVDVIQPLFPRYLFVALSDKEQSISPVQYTAGVSKMVRFSVDYVPVPQGIIEALQAREDPETGYHRLTTPNLKKGERVRIQSGAFAGIEGVFEARSGKDRVIVLFELLGQRARTEIAFEELER